MRHAAAWPGRGRVYDPDGPGALGVDHHSADTHVPVEVTTSAVTGLKSSFEAERKKRKEKQECEAAEVGTTNTERPAVVQIAGLGDWIKLAWVSISRTDSTGTKAPTRTSRLGREQNSR
jgi:hypothetical protein